MALVMAYLEGSKKRYLFALERSIKLLTCLASTEILEISKACIFNINESS